MERLVQIEINVLMHNAFAIVVTYTFQSYVYLFKLMKGKALRKHSLHEKTAASVLLKLFISGNE